MVLCKLLEINNLQVPNGQDEATPPSRLIHSISWGNIGQLQKTKKGLNSSLFPFLHWYPVQCGFAAPLPKRWTLFPCPLNLGWSCDMVWLLERGDGIPVLS